MSKTNPPDDRSEPPPTVRPTTGPLLNAPAPGPAADLGALGKYKLLKQIGKGGMGAVFLAQDTDLDRDVAIKTLLPEIAKVPQHRERFLREARLAAKIKHPNVITIYTVEEIDDTPLIVMERLKGQSLEDYIRKGGQLGPLQITRIAREMVSGLEAAHQLGMIHRDIKPANVWLEAPKGRVRVLDFGLAVRPEQDLRISVSGMVMGTPHYMPPEQAMGKKVDHRADLFSVGVVLYRMCTGQFPFDGEGLTGVLIAVATQTPITPSQLNPTVPPAMDDLILRLLAKKPDDRPADAAAVLAVLARPMAWGAGASKIPGGTGPAVAIEAVPDTVRPQAGHPTKGPADTVRPPVPPLAEPEEPDEDDLDRAAGRVPPAGAFPPPAVALPPVIVPLLPLAAPPPVPGEPRPGRGKALLVVGAVVAAAVAGGLAYVVTDGFRTLGGSPGVAVAGPPTRPKDAPPATKPADPPPKPAAPPRPDDEPPPPPAAPTTGTLVLLFDEGALARLYGFTRPRLPGRPNDRVVQPGDAADREAARDIRLFIDDKETPLDGRLTLDAGRHTVQVKRGVEGLFPYPQGVTVRAGDSTTLKVPAFPARDGTITLTFGRLSLRAPDELKVWIDGVSKPQYRVSVSAFSETQLSVSLPAGEHRFAVRYRDIEVFAKAATVNPPGVGRSLLPVTLTATGTVRIKNVTSLDAGVEAYAYVDGKQTRQWEVGRNALELEVEVGRHAVEVRVLRAPPGGKRGLIDSFEVTVKPGETHQHDIVRSK